MAKRLHDGYEQDPDHHQQKQPEDKRVRHLPSFSTVIREAVFAKHMQSLFRMVLEPLLRRVLQEELQAGLLAGSRRYIMERSPAERPTLKLAFRNPAPQLPIFTGSKIEDAHGNPLEIILVDARTGSPAAAHPPPQALRVELVPVVGDFPPDDDDGAGSCWSAEEFRRNVVKAREGRRPLLTGDVSHVVRDDGRAVAVNELRFTDNSSWVRCRKFRIGVRAVAPPGGDAGGRRVLEAVTEAFVVRDHRGELYRKHYPPVLADDLWRLDRIAKDGAFHRKLARHGVSNVQEFLRMLTVKPDELRAILGESVTDRMWEATTSHARTCAPGGKVFAHSAAHGTVYVDSVFNLVKVEIGGVECPVQQLDRVQTNFVQQLVLNAYEHRHGLQEVDVVVTLHGHAPAITNTFPQLQNAAQASLPAASATDAAVWIQNNAGMDFQLVDDDEVVVPLPQAPNYTFQWPG